jgi:hypothetical protein
MTSLNDVVAVSAQTFRHKFLIVVAGVQFRADSCDIRDGRSGTEACSSQFLSSACIHFTTALYLSPSLEVHDSPYQAAVFEYAASVLVPALSGFTGSEFIL